MIDRYPLIDLNNSPPHSPDPQNEKVIDKADEGNKIIITETESRGKKRKERSNTSTKEKQIIKPRRMVHVYPPGLSKAEKARFRNKARYNSKVSCQHCTKKLPVCL